MNRLPHVVLWPSLVVFVLAVWGVWALTLAQPMQDLELKPESGAEGENMVYRPATSFEPEKVRTLMLSIHGYTRDQLQAVSTDVDQILMVIAEDPDESLLVRRQAIKGMRLYPTDAVLEHIEARVDTAPLGLKQLYLSSLSGFAASHPERVVPIMEAALNDERITLRYAGLNLAQKLEASRQVSGILQARIAVESDSVLRSQIEQELR